MRASRGPIFTAILLFVLSACRADGDHFECGEDDPCEPDTVCHRGLCLDTAEVRLTVSAESVGATATVTVLDGAGVPCEAMGCAAFPYGSPVVLRAGEAAGFRFSGWSGDAACVGTAPELVIDHLNQDLHCSANYTRRLRVIGFVSGLPEGSSGGVAASTASPSAICSGGSCEVDRDTPVKLVAPARWGERFGGWSGAGCGDATTPETTVTPIDTDIVCTGNYVRRLSVTAHATGTNAQVAVTSSTRGSVCEQSTCLLDRGGNAAVSAPEVAGFRFAGWSGTGRCAGFRASFVIDPVEEPQRCVATYVPRVQVTGSASGVVPPPRVTALSTDAFARCIEHHCEIDSGGSAMLLASSAPGYRLTGWTGPMCGQATSPALQLVQVASDVACVAEYRLGIAVIGAVVGAVGEVQASSTTPGASCARGGCVIDAGGNATLVAPALPDQRFLGWEGDPGCTGTSATIQFPMVAESRTCFARYAPRFEVSGFAAPLEGGSVRASSPSASATCTGPRCLLEGGEVVLEATPQPGYRFSGFSGGPNCAGTSPSLRIPEVTGNLRCQANFVGRVRVTATALPEAGGVVSVQPEAGSASCIGSVCEIDRDARIVLAASPREGYAFVGFSGCSNSREPTLLLPPPRTDLVCVARFQSPRFTVTATVSPSGGGSVALSADAASSDCAAGSACEVSAGAAVRLAASPAAGFRFVGWTGCALATTPVIALPNVQRDASCQALFEREPSALTTVSVGVGSGAGSVGAAVAGIPCPRDTCLIPSGARVTLSAAPAAGYAFVGWVGCSVIDSPSAPENSVLGASDGVRCSANFEQLLSVSVGAADGTLGSVNVTTADCAGERCLVRRGSTATLRAMPSLLGAAFTSWSGSGCPLGSALETVVTVSAPLRCIGNFTPPPADAGVAPVPAPVALPRSLELPLLGLPGPDAGSARGADVDAGVGATGQ